MRIPVLSLRGQLKTGKRTLTFLLKLSELVPGSIVSRFSSLKNNLARASIRMSFKAYLGLMVLVSLVAFLVVFSFSLVVFSFFLEILSSFVFSVLIAALSFAVSVGVCFAYPFLNISSRARKIDANLPLIANFMSVLSGSGMPPERVIRSLANVGDEFSVGNESRRIVADIELLGIDLHTALKNGASRSPSKKFGILLDGLVTTSHTGADMASYLRDEAEKYKKTRLQTAKSFLESLALIAEAYVSFMIALPLVLIIMLSVMSFIGGGAFLAGIDPHALLIVVTFLLTPAGVAIMLLLVDSMTPPR
jgi:flagellar protein FlaJ